jgi:hypothetical protein
LVVIIVIIKTNRDIYVACNNQKYYMYLYKCLVLRAEIKIVEIMFINRRLLYSEKDDQLLQKLFVNQCLEIILEEEECFFWVAVKYTY